MRKYDHKRGILRRVRENEYRYPEFEQISSYFNKYGINFGEVEIDGNEHLCMTSEPFNLICLECGDIESTVEDSDTLSCIMRISTDREYNEIDESENLGDIVLNIIEEGTENRIFYSDVFAEHPERGTGFSMVSQSNSLYEEIGDGKAIMFKINNRNRDEKGIYLLMK